MPNQTTNPNEWVDLYADALYSYCFKFIPNPDIAQNLIQETFLAALKSQNNFQGTSSQKTWLIGILKNKINDHLRLKYREIPASQIIDDDISIEQFFDKNQYGHLKKEPTHWDFPSHDLSANQEFWVIFNDCLSRVPEKSAQAFSLREIDGMATQEICKILNVSSTNLWVLLHRARLQLRQCLEINWFEHK